MTSEKIERINQLARKSKTAPLTPDELSEQKRLRDEYRAGIKRNLEGTLERIEIVDA
jgi:uncharacterized protein YnzC (UPF0291/DUF896 family)